jgi:hypothetical protein
MERETGIEPATSTLGIMDSKFEYKPTILVAWTPTFQILEFVAG